MSHINLSKTRDNIPSESIGSIGTESNTLKEQNGGGLLSFLFDSGDKGQLITKAFHKGNVNAAVFLIEENFKIDCNYVDEHNRNALHYMVSYASYNKCIRAKLEEILNGGVDKRCVNLQDNVDKNTPLHIAVASGDDAIADLLIANGADKSLKNKYGDFVKDEPEQEKKNCNTNVFIKAANGPSNDEINKRLDNIVKLFATRSENSDTIGFDRHEAENTATIVEPIIEQPVNSYAPAPVDITDAGNVDSPETDQFISDIFKRLQQGGGKKSMRNVFTRKVSTYSENPISEGGHWSSGSSDFESSISDYSEYARAANNQKNELHQEAVKKIMKVLDIDDEYVARSYKALLYQKIKDEDPENKLSGLDRATKMLDLVKKTELKKFSKDEIDPIYDHLVKKDKEREERLKDMPKKEKKEKKQKSKKSKKSSEESVDSSEMSSSESLSDSQARLSLADSEFLTSNYGLSSDL